MATLTPAEVTNFVGGLVTDANPMSFPANASLDEYNMVINQDGTRSRRLGMDVESPYQTITATLNKPVDSTITYRTFKWTNVGGIPNLTFVVVQIGNYIGIHSTSTNSLTENGVLFSHYLDTIGTLCSFASVDGLLVVASSNKELLSISYLPASNTFEVNPYRLLIRDTFGLTDVLDGVDYNQGSNIAKRPITLTPAHSYNLRNQTFALPKKSGGVLQEAVRDPIYTWNRHTDYETFPSNADSILDAFYPNSASELDPFTNRFHPLELSSNPPGTLRAPTGYFIIDALDRGRSRLEETEKLYAENPILKTIYKPASLPLDSTPAGANCLAQFAGRMFYSGFTSEVIDGDENSPRLGSYVLFSKLVENYRDLMVCYQTGDPTSKDHSELLDTDGGFIRLEGAYNIQAMVPMPTGLAILAENGVWLISGEDRGQFKATSYSTSKISPNGCDSPSSVIITGDGFMYWSRDGIYQVAPNQFGDLKSTNMTMGKIQKFYGSISPNDRKYAVGVIDKYERKAKWIYGNRLNEDTLCRELIYSFDFSSFTSNRISRATLSNGDGVTTPTVVAAPVVMPAFSASSYPELIYVGSDLVLVGTDSVLVPKYEVLESLTETKYLVITNYEEAVIEYTFSSYSQPYHYDWDSVSSSGGVDAESVILTGWSGGGDYQRNKQIPFLMMHFYKTETSFAEVDSDDPYSEWVVENQSSCLVQSQWNWANHTNSGKWGTPFQSYRFSRFWQPELLTDSYDNGFYTVETRNKLRGSGKVISLKFTSEPGKHMNIIGWSMMLQGRSSV